jgi:poly-gamma-glutamate capsule biosynthesis protein CapA/YwtB (metallophosphatase superfamily)
MLGCQPKAVRSEEAVNAAPPAADPTPKNKLPITIAAVGDIMLGSTSINDSYLPPNDGADILKEVTPILSKADMTFGNLEGPMLEGGTSTKCPAGSKRCFAFRVPTRYGKYLKQAGFDVMSLANNHAGDFGDYGRSSTRKVLDDLGIKYAGSDNEQFSTAYLEVKGKRIAVVGFAHNNIVPNVNDLDNARRLVTEAKKRADIVIVSFHGGAEGTDQQHVPNHTEYFAGEARGNLPLFAHTVIDAGASLVLGHGPHVMRGLEMYKDHLICYSLGNFATYGMFSLKAETAITEILEVTIDSDGKFVSGKIVAGKQEGKGGPQLDPSNAAIRVVRGLSQADFGTNAPKIADDGTVTPK